MLHRSHVRHRALSKHARHGNASVSALLDRAKGHTDSGRRTQLYGGEERVPMTDHLWILLHEAAYVLHQPCVTGAVLRPIDWTGLELAGVER